MTPAVHAGWHPLDLHGVVKYPGMRTRQHASRRWPAADLPDEIPVGDGAPIATGAGPSGRVSAREVMNSEQRDGSPAP